MTVTPLTWRSLPVFPRRDYCQTLLANDALASLADRVAVQLPGIVDRIRSIDRPRDDEPQAVAA